MKFLKPIPFSLTGTPTILKSLSGEVIRYPPNASHRFRQPFKGLVGIEALKLFFDEERDVDRLRNQAQCNYLYMRDNVLKTHTGMWIAVSSNRSFYVDTHENVVRHIAEDIFRSPEEDYFVTCIGCEAIGYVDMGERYVVHGEKESEDELYIDAEYSLSDLNNFHFARMKLSTGAAMMGIPSSALTQEDLRRGRDEIHVASDGKRTKTKTYENVHVKIDETVITTRAIEASKWIIGYPIWSKFKISIDTTRTPAVALVPHV